MKTTLFSDAQIMHCPTAHVYMCERGILKQAEGGRRSLSCVGSMG
jgi:hypothetical protein